MGTQGAGYPDTPFLEHQFSQEKYILQIFSTFVGKVNFCFPWFFLNGLPLVSGEMKEKEKSRHGNLECIYQMGQGELPPFHSFLFIQLVEPAAAAAS